MATEPTQSSLILPAEELAARNEQARAARDTLAAQQSITSPGARAKSTDDFDAEDALAKHLHEAERTAPKEGDESGVPRSAEVTPAPGVPVSPAAPKPPVPQKTPAEIEAEEAAASAKSGEDTLEGLLAQARTEATEAEKPAVQTPPKPESAFSDHTLPANASQKSKDSFENLKRAASEREAAQRARADAAEAKIAAAEAAAAEAKAQVGKLTPELEQELKELREHRALFATESDPTFKSKYEGRQAQHYEAIYAELRRHQLPEATITELKALSKADRDWNIDQYVSKLTNPADKRPIEAKQLQIQAIEDEKAEELLTTKAKAAELVKAQREAPAQQTQAKIDEIANLVKPKIAGMKWFDVKDIPADTPPEAKKALEENNRRAVAYREHLRLAIVNDDPQTRAAAALAVPLSYYYAREAAMAQAQVKTLQEKLDKIVKASATSRLSERASVRSDAPIRTDVDSDPQDAVDALFRQASENAPPTSSRR
jgi:hypothetical protein